MSIPFFSLITPVYKIEHLIANTIESALEQSYTNWEMIIIDDGSPDKAGSICDEYGSKDSRISVIHKEKNEGLAAARNTGIKLARGKYIWIYEGSDMFHDKDTLQSVYNDLAGTDVDIYFGLLQDVMEGSLEVTSIQKKYSLHGLMNMDGRKLFAHLFDNKDTLALASPVNKIYKNSFIKDNHLQFHEGICHDGDEWIPRAISLSKSSMFTDRIIYSALTWNGCFGGMVNEQSLVRKACDKIFIADHCCNDIDQRYPEQGTDFKSKYYEYYIRIFISGVLMYNEIQNDLLRGRINDTIRRHKSIWQYMSKCNSKNLRLMGALSRILGTSISCRIIRRRYRKKAEK